MDDVIFVGLFAAVMTLAYGYVRLCARVVGDATSPENPERGR